MARNDERMPHCNFYLVETHVSLALGESRTKRDQEPRKDKWYFAIEVWACAWTIENMHKASAKLKLNLYLICNVSVVKKLR